MPFDPAKSKKLYQNGISNETKKIKKQTKQNPDWPIFDSQGNLIGFIGSDSEDLPAEIWIRDKRYQITSKISKD